MNVNLADRDGWTPLHAAAQNNDAETARFLLDSGAIVDPQDSYGNTPLFRAVFNSRDSGELIELLRQRGADAESKNKSGVSPVSLARTIANCDITQFFDDRKEVERPIFQAPIQFGLKKQNDHDPTKHARSDVNVEIGVTLTTPTDRPTNPELW